MKKGHIFLFFYKSEVLQKWGDTVPQCPPCSVTHESTTKQTYSLEDKKAVFPDCYERYLDIIVNTVRSISSVGKTPFVSNISVKPFYQLS